MEVRFLATMTHKIIAFVSKSLAKNCILRYNICDISLFGVARMKVFLFGELTEQNISMICPNGTVIGKKAYVGYSQACSRAGRAFIKEGSDSIDGFIFECDGLDLWRLDQWKNVLFLQRGLVDADEEIYTYFTIYESMDNSAINYAGDEVIRQFVSNINKHNSLRMADVHLLIPGYSFQKPINVEGAYFGRILQDSIQSSNENEFSSDFLKDCKRFTLGRVEIKRDDTYQLAILTLMCHSGTRLCVVDIYIPAIETSAHGVLESYCGNFIRLRYQDVECTLSELCKKIGVTEFGSRRSLVFSYEKLTEESMLNLLVNEEHPMGKIMGSYFKDVINHNLAQYDTAEVYATEVTMLEMTDRIENNVLTRMQSQAVEIFFVEMLLLQDAAVSKMYDRVQREIAYERENPLRKNAGKIISELVDDAAYATTFTDYQQFLYPTVRVSAEKVAKAFGIDNIQKKYNQNKVFLEQMIRDHNAEISKKENRIKNSLLIIITLLSGTKTIYEAFNSLTSSAYASFAYYIAMTIMLFGVLLYFGVRRIVRHRAMKQARDRLREHREQYEIK